MPKQISSKIISLSFSILAIVFLAAFSVLSWTEPGSSPPTGNVPTPLNIGDVSQIKAASLSFTKFFDYPNTSYYLDPDGQSVLAGPVGIGTTIPTAKLHISQAGVNSETLRPNGAGTTTLFPIQFPNSTYHWDKVDEASPDNDATYVAQNTYWAGEHDSYALTNPTGSGNIISVTEYWRVRRTDTSQVSQTKGSLTIGGVDYPDYGGGTWIDIPTDLNWHDYSYVWTANPATGFAWTWSDITSLEAGVWIATQASATRLTQVYVVVRYGDATGGPYFQIDRSGGTTQFIIDTDGNVGIGTTPVVGNKLDVSGKIHAADDVCTDLGGGKCLSAAVGGGVIITYQMNPVSSYFVYSVEKGYNEYYSKSISYDCPVGTVPTIINCPKIEYRSFTPDGPFLNFCSCSVSGNKAILKSFARQGEWNCSYTPPYFSSPVDYCYPYKILGPFGYTDCYECFTIGPCAGMTFQCTKTETVGE